MIVFKILFVGFVLFFLVMWLNVLWVGLKKVILLFKFVVGIIFMLLICVVSILVK